MSASRCATLSSPVEAARWLRGRVRGELQTDSRRVRAGDGFIAWPGAARDARAFVRQTLEQGVSACLVEQEGAQAFGFDDERIALYAGLKAGSGPVAAAYYDDPSARLAVLAVTGTNGKTSTTWWLALALSVLRPEAPCGLVGTLGVGRVPPPGVPLASTVRSTGLTTPDPVLLQQTLRTFVDEGLSACALEASSIGMAERRLDGTRIDTALFTNFTQDHLDYHGTMDAYWEAKAALFDWTGLRVAIINVDDPRGAALAQSLALRPGLDLWTVSIDATRAARLQARGLRMGRRGVEFVACLGNEQVPFATAVLGDYNVSNLLGVLAALCALGYALSEAVRACEGLQAVPGRMEFQGGQGAPLVVVDYAHTPDALAQVMGALAPLAQSRGGQFWCVFGCGGDRDPMKRPLMGQAARAADHIVVTSDNPRGEDPHRIADAVLQGCAGHPSVRVELDRARAIALAVGDAGLHDIVLVAGKGHEDYQEIAGVRRDFSDATQVRLALGARGTSGGDQGAKA